MNICSQHIAMSHRLDELYEGWNTAGTHEIVLPRGTYEIDAVGGAGGGAAYYAPSSWTNNYGYGSFSVASGGCGGALRVVIRLKAIAVLHGSPGMSGADNIGLTRITNPKTAGDGGNSLVYLTALNSSEALSLCWAYGGIGGQAGSSAELTKAGDNGGYWVDGTSGNYLYDIISRTVYSGTSATGKRNTTIYYKEHTSASRVNPISTGASTGYPSSDSGCSAGLGMYKTSHETSSAYIEKESGVISNGMICVSRIG